MIVWELFFITLAVVVAAIVARSGAARITQRYRLAWTDPDALALPASWSAATLRICTVLAALQLACGLAILWAGVTEPAPIRLTSGALLAGGLASAAAMFFQAGRRFAPSTVAVAVGLLALAIAGGLLLVLAGGMSAGPLRRLSCLLIALAVQVWFWAWIAGVWEQQLDRGAAWTTAGRLLAWTPRVALILALLALMASGGLLYLLTAGYGGAPGHGAVWAIGGHVILLAGLGRALRTWRRRVFTGLLILGCGALIASLALGLR